MKLYNIFMILNMISILTCFSESRNLRNENKHTDNEDYAKDYIPLETESGEGYFISWRNGVRTDEKVIDIKQKFEEKFVNKE